MSFIGCTDQPAVKDEFKIEKYINGLRTFITECQTPITIAVQGDWGSGKTSVMNMVISELEDTVFPITFNAWQFSQFASEESLTISLIKTIIHKIGTAENETEDEPKTGLQRFTDGVVETRKKIADGAKAATEVMARAGANLVGEKLMGSGNMAAINEGLNSIRVSMDTIATLKEKFQDCVLEATEKLGVERLLIFIDDLDRLQPIRAVELLEVLKIFLDCEKCVFVLAIDYNVVVSGVKSKYGVDITANKGRSFFDKIIQVPFKMPVAQYDISGFVEKTLKESAHIECDREEIENFVALINSSENSNPRSMKRLFNSFLLLLYVMEEELQGDAVQGKKTLFAILCMQQHLEQFYNFVAVNVAAAHDGVITADFFSGLAAADNPGDFLKDRDYTFQSEDANEEANEARQIQSFVKCFNRAISADGSETINNDCMGRIRSLLKTSSVTATEAPAHAATKKKRIFVYKGQEYMPGAAKMNMGKLASTLIKDYAAETGISAAGLMELVNTKNFCGPAYKKAGLAPICERNHPAFAGDEKLAEGYISDPEAVLLVNGKELLIYRWWSHEVIDRLIGELGYGDRVNSSLV